MSATSSSSSSSSSATSSISRSNPTKDLEDDEELAFQMTLIQLGLLDRNQSIARADEELAMREQFGGADDKGKALYTRYPSLDAVKGDALYFPASAVLGDVTPPPLSRAQQRSPQPTKPAQDLSRIAIQNAQQRAMTPPAPPAPIPAEAQRIQAAGLQVKRFDASALYASPPSSPPAPAPAPTLACSSSSSPASSASSAPLPQWNWTPVVASLPVVSVVTSPAAPSEPASPAVFAQALSSSPVHAPPAPAVALAPAISVAPLLPPPAPPAVLAQPKAPMSYAAALSASAQAFVPKGAAQLQPPPGL
jgi:hypothetical protein